MRGNPGLVRAAALSTGSIPAYAGEPSPRAGGRNLPRVYPRVCGGTPSERAPGLVCGGLSPRMRGNPTPPLPPGPGNRSIPAYAGEPPDIAAMPAHPGVYPRVCGGTPESWLPGRKTRGLSPRMRGNRRRPGGDIRGGGSIPAYAGEPPDIAAMPAHPGVYPRVCGGTGGKPLRAGFEKGLSPRMRGNPMPIPPPPLG